MITICEHNMDTVSLFGLKTFGAQVVFLFICNSIWSIVGSTMITDSEDDAPMMIPDSDDVAPRPARKRRGDSDQA